MKIESPSPVDEEITDIGTTLILGERALAEDQPDDYPGALAVKAGQRALLALVAVVDAMADLEPSAALIINDALRRGLGMTS